MYFYILFTISKKNLKKVTKIYTCCDNPRLKLQIQAEWIKGQISAQFLCQETVPEWMDLRKNKKKLGLSSDKSKQKEIRKKKKKEIMAVFP